MDLKNVEYVFTITGGGWTTQHDLYAITKDRKVLHTEKFDDLEAASPEYLFDLEEDLDFEEHGNNVGFDAPDLTMYKVKEGKLKKLYAVGMYHNSPAVDMIVKLHYFYLHRH